MSITKPQYDEIMRGYNRRDLLNQYALRERTEHLYNKIPRLREIQNDIIALSIARAKAKVLNFYDSEQVYREKLKELMAEKEMLLHTHRYPIDYLTLQPSCPDCQDTGYIGAEKCLCFKQAIIDILYSQSNVKDILREENFEHFSYEYYSGTEVDPDTGITPLANIQKVVSICKSFIENFDDTFCNLLFYGATGTGKTFLTNCVAKELMDSSHSVIYLSAIQLFDIFEEHTFHHNGESAYTSDIVKYILDCDLLIIDDLGTELVNSFTNSSLFRCLNERSVGRKSTVISTNLPLEDLQNRYSERILSRIISSYTPLLLFGQDIRIRKKIYNYKSRGDKE